MAFRSAQVDAEVEVSEFNFSGSPSNAASRLADMCSKILYELNGGGQRRGFWSPCHGRLYRRRGADTVICGPGRLEDAHSDHEAIDVAAIEQYILFLAELILRVEEEENE